MSKINLLPSGHFEVTLNDGGIIKGRYSAKALKMLADLNGGLSFTETWALLAGANSTITNYLQLVVCAINSEGGKVDEFGVLSIIDDLGGFASEETQSLFAHFMEGFVPKKKSGTERSISWGELLELGCEAGLVPSEFWCCTIPEILNMIEGYHKRLYQSYSMNRSLRYSLYCLTAKSPIDIWDWEPLEGDPTKEERETMKLRNQIKTENEYLETKRYYEAQGIEVM